jgi:hypothetical protein
MNGSFGNGYPLENGQGKVFNALFEFAGADQSRDFGMISSVGMSVSVIFVVMVVPVAMVMLSVSVMMILSTVRVVMVMMGHFLAVVAIVAAHQEPPSRNSVALSAFESTGGKFDPQGVQGFLEDTLRNP